MMLALLYLIYVLGLAACLARGGLLTVNAASIALSGKPVTRVLIIGARGGTGRQLLAQALERGYQVTAFLHAPSTISADHPRLAVVQGDVLDYSSVEKAVIGQDAVISALGHKRYFVPTRILSEGTRNILRAMAAHGVRRFVCETSLGIGDSTGRMGLYYSLFVIPFILPFYFWDKIRQERVIAASALEWVIVRPAALTNAKMRGAYRSGRRVGSFMWTARIARGDVAHFMLNQLADNENLGTAVGICW